MKDSVYSRYALALFSIAKEDNKINEYQNEMKEISTLFNDNIDFFNLLKSEFVTLVKRCRLVDETFSSYSKVVRNFLKVLIQNHRLNDFSKIFISFNSMCNEENHVLEGIVYSVESLSKEKINELETALTKKHKEKVELTNKINPSLIGGIKIVLNNSVYDYSIQNELDTLKSRLNG